jgi:hypothetical protein
MTACSLQQGLMRCCDNRVQDDRATSYKYTQATKRATNIEQPTSNITIERHPELYPLSSKATATTIEQPTIEQQHGSSERHPELLGVPTSTSNKAKATTHRRTKCNKHNKPSEGDE